MITPDSLQTTLGWRASSRELALPRLDQPVLDAGLADVVEHELHLGAAPRELDREHQTPVLEADVEGQSVLGEEAQPIEEIRGKADARIGLALDQPPDAAQGAILQQPLQIGLHRGALLQRRVGDHPRQPRILVGQLLHPGRLREMQPLVDRDLREHQPVDHDLGAAAVEVAEVVTPVDLGHPLQPAVAQPARVVEMDVAVDDREAWHAPLLCRPCMATGC